MPVLFLVAGLLLIVTAIRGTTGDFASRLQSDVSGGFLKWVAAIVVVGAIGYAPGLKEPSRYLLALVAIVILLSNGSGFISKFAQQIQNPGTATTAAPAGGNANLPAIPVQTQTQTSGTASSNNNSAGSARALSALTSLAGLFGGT
jgi:hypothetical protein